MVAYSARAPCSATQTRMAAGDARAPAGLGHATGRERRVVEQLRGQAAARAAAESRPRISRGARHLSARRRRDHNTAADRPTVAQHAQARGPATTSCAEPLERNRPATRPWCAYVPAINKLQAADRHRPDTGSEGQAEVRGRGRRQRSMASRSSRMKPNWTTVSAVWGPISRGSIARRAVSGVAEQRPRPVDDDARLAGSSAR